jgi:hypothetical protein
MDRSSRVQTIRDVGQILAATRRWRLGWRLTGRCFAGVGAVTATIGPAAARAAAAGGEGEQYQ